MATPLGCYRGVAGEVATDAIWRAAAERGWETAAPAGAGDGYVWRSAGGAWTAGAHGIEEPEGGEEVAAAALRAVVVPGLAFDVRGTRLGHGKGHFDRLLAGAEGALKIGLCTESRLAGELPREAHDAAVDVVVTERRTLYAPGAEEKLARWFGGA
jgi:5-formyltetrahydrofolate cyclo-ligase